MAAEEQTRNLSRLNTLHMTATCVCVCWFIKWSQVLYLHFAVCEFSCIDLTKQSRTSLEQNEKKKKEWKKFLCTPNKWLTNKSFGTPSSIRVICQQFIYLFFISWHIILLSIFTCSPWGRDEGRAHICSTDGPRVDCGHATTLFQPRIQGYSFTNNSVYSFTLSSDISITFSHALAHAYIMTCWKIFLFFLLLVDVGGCEAEGVEE